MNTDITVSSTCPRCYSGYATKRGTKRGKQRLHCKNCGKWYANGLKLVATRTPKILLFDIETLPMKIYAWDLYPHYYSPDNIIQDYNILSWSGKWLFGSEVYKDVLTSKEAIAREDFRVVSSMWKLLDEADIVIAHNGKRFDVRKLNTRFLYFNMQPPSPYQVIDTFKAAKDRFDFSSNKMDYINRYLELNQKIDTDFQLWIDCDHGNKKALETMITYNVYDVLILEEMYVRIRAWIPQHPNMNVYTTTDESGCPICGTKDLLLGGVYSTPANLYRSFRCSNCGAIGRSSSTDLTTKKRKNMIKVIA